MIRYFLGAYGVVYNFAESFVDNVVFDKVKPVPGSILYTDLAFGYMEHSGVYIGQNQIVHLNSAGKVEIVSPDEFLGHTAISIYVSSKGTDSVGNDNVAKKANYMVGASRDYNFLMDNCHQFSAGCMNGNFNNSSNFLWMLKDEAKKYLGSDNWRVWDLG